MSNFLVVQAVAEITAVNLTQVMNFTFTGTSVHFAFEVRILD